MLKKPELFKNGYHLSYFTLNDEIKNLVIQEKWDELDQEFKLLTSKDGQLFKTLNAYHDFESIEFIISIRDSNNEWEEDGIWHDDGSRVFAFSLSLTLGVVNGGRLGLRIKGNDTGATIPTPSFGGLIMFLTGIYGFEHKIQQVTSGKRVIIAGWCS